MRIHDYSERDKNGKFVFYVPLWKRNGISLDMFDDYWRNVHGPVCSRLPGQHQYWQLHVDRNVGGLWPVIDGVNTATADDDQFHGIAELTFRTDKDRQTWFMAAGILMDDEHNLFSKGVGYNTAEGNSRTYVDGIENGEPNGKVPAVKFHVMVRKADGVSVSDFRKYMKETLAENAAKSPYVLKLRLHLFEEVDNTRPDAPGVIHVEPAEKQYHGALEIGFGNNIDMENFFVSGEFAKATSGISKFVRQLSPFPERNVYAFVYNDKMTLAGMRGSTAAELITNIGAVNQLKDNIVNLMLGK